MRNRSSPGPVPAQVTEAAERRSAARAARDWATADELRGEIEAAGWRVTDSGTGFRLVRAHPADRVVGGEIRYGRSDAVPSRLDEAPTGVATVVVAIERGDPAAAPSVTAAARHLPAGVDLVVVGDALDDDAAGAIRDVLDGPSGAGSGHELVRTSAPLGRAAALNAGIRRASGAVVVVLDSSVRPTGDAVSPLVAALDAPGVAVAGPFGLETTDLRTFEEVLAPGDEAVEATAIQGYCMAFRRSDYMERGPLDEGFRFYRNLDVWWSLVLRDAGEAEAHRALVVPNLPVTRSEPWAWTSTPPQERDRLSKRNFYRVLDRFRARPDLVAPAAIKTARGSGKSGSGARGSSARR